MLFKNIYLAIVLALPGIAAAQPFPSKPIRIIVAYTPAGATDILARAVGQKMSERFGQPVIVDNRPGATGNIGTDTAAKANADGHTLLMATAATHGINPSLYRTLPWDAVTDFAPISLVALVPNIMVVHNSVPAKSVKEFIAYLKAHPNKFNYGSPGNGSTGHLSQELFKTMTGTHMQHIPYKGSAGVMADVMGGQIIVTIDNMPVYLPQVKAGKLRALAVSAAQRSPAMPDLPTIAEAGVPGYNTSAWFGLVAPAGTPRPVIDKLAAETQRILKLPDVSERLSALGAEPVGERPEQFAAHIKAEIAKWAKVIREANVALQ